MKTPKEICDAAGLICVVVERGDTDTPELRRHREKLMAPMRIGTGGIMDDSQPPMYDDPFADTAASFADIVTRLAVNSKATMLIWHELPAVHCKHNQGKFWYHIDALVSWDG